MNLVRLEVSITGRVQGVFYRQSTQDTANRLGLAGWVRNCPDGSVAAVFEGERVAVEAALAWCHQGPSAARVENITTKWLDYQGEFSEFAVRR